LPLELPSALGAAKSPGDVARFHLGNGARLERLDFLADTSTKALRQSHGLMVNYLYDLDHIEKSHEAYAEHRTVVAASAVTKLARPALELVAKNA
jgi:malonyl-CoA decarboxylase